MNALVALGTFAAFAYSSVVTFAPTLLPANARNVYFEAAGGDRRPDPLWPHAGGQGQVARQHGHINALADLQPDTARMSIEGETEIDRPVQSLRLGDLIRIRPGERIPTDGEVVIEGTSLVNEAMISGEPMPVDQKVKNDPVIRCHDQWRRRVLTVQSHPGIGSDTVLSGIIAMVRDAQATKLPIEALIDRVTAWFVPAVLACRGCRLLIVWLLFDPPLAIVAAVSVLIIACPCAMGLAVPTSIMVGMARAASAGVLFRQGDAIERLRDIKTVAFDKTGTLTEGAPKLVHFETTAAFDRDTVLNAAAAVERQSEHPIARAIGDAAPDAPEATGVTSITGKGIQGKLNGQTIRIGNTALLQSDGIDTTPLVEAQAKRAAQGETAFFVAIEDQLAGLLTVADPIKPTAAEAIAALHNKGIRTVMISGDATATANAVAQSLGIDQVIADALPEPKLTHIRDLANTGPVAFVGDGINDAPALAAADVGIALGTGTDVAMETADVVLMSGDPNGVATAHALSQTVMRNVKQNLGWAFGYNALLIPVAAGVLYPAFGLLLSPMLAAAAMAFSSVAVVTNALRLKRIRL